MKISIVGHATPKKIIGRRIDCRYTYDGWRGMSLEEVQNFVSVQDGIPEGDTVFYRISAPLEGRNSNVYFAGDQVHNLKEIIEQVMSGELTVTGGEIKSYCYIINQRINVFPTYEKLEKDIKKRKWEIKTNDFKMKMKLLKSKKEEVNVSSS